VSHHKIIGNRYTDPAPMKTTLVNVSSTQIKADYNMIKNSTVLSATNDWHVGHLLNRIKFNDGSQLLISSYAAPVSAGKSLFIGNQIFIHAPGNTVNKTSLPKQASHFHMKSMPVWLQHAALSFVLHQDHALLHKQEIGMQKAGVNNKNFASRIYSPNGQDNIVLWLKHWLSRTESVCTGDIVPLETGDIFDVYHSHTKDCKYCSTALVKLSKSVLVLQYSSLVVLIMALWLHDSFLIGLSGGLWLVTIGLEKAKSLLLTYNYSHQDNI
jgi:hypothetical protein